VIRLLNMTLSFLKNLRKLAEGIESKLFKVQCKRRDSNFAVLCDSVYLSGTILSAKQHLVKYEDH
jgi:hypothetical protein